MPTVDSSYPILADNPSCNPLCRVCHYKAFDYSTQLDRKRKWAEDQLHRWRDVLKEIRPAVPEERLAYRSKSWMRSSFENGEVSFGMFRSIKVEGQWEKEFISWNSCPIHLQPIQEMVTKLRQVLSEKAPRFIEQSLVGIWLGSPHLVIVSREPDSEAVRRLDWSRVLVPPFNRVWFHCNSQVGRKIFGHRPIEAIVGPPKESGHPIRAFRQVAQTLLIEARRLALETLLRTQPTLLLDLYCGTGDFSLLLPPEMGWIGIESSKEATQFANSLRHSNAALHAAFAGTVEQRLRDPSVLNKIEGPYALYLNPPRSGLTEEARERVLALIHDKPPTSVIYLSCSASSLARDLEEFEKAGYRIKLLQPYDFFPQTEHFETLAILELRL